MSPVVMHVDTLHLPFFVGGFSKVHKPILSPFVARIREVYVA